MLIIHFWNLMRLLPKKVVPLKKRIRYIWTFSYFTNKNQIGKWLFDTLLNHWLDWIQFSLRFARSLFHLHSPHQHSPPTSPLEYYSHRINLFAWEYIGSTSRIWNFNNIQKFPKIHTSIMLCCLICYHQYV